MNSEVEIFGATDDLFYIRHGRNYGFYPKTHLREKAKGYFPHTIEIDLSNLKGINPQVRQENFLYQFLSGQVAPQILESDNITTDTINSTTKTADKEEFKPVNSNQVPETIEKKQEAIQPPVSIEKNPEEPQFKVEEQQPKEVPASVVKTPEVPDISSTEEDDEEFDDTEDDEEEEEDDDLEDVETNPIPEANDKPFVPPPMPAIKAQENPDTKQPELMAIPPSKDTDSKTTTENTKKDELSNEIPAPVQPKQPSFTEEILDFFDFGSETPEPTPQTAEEDFKVLQQNVPEFVPMKEEVVEKAEIIATEIPSDPIPVQNKTISEKMPEKYEEKVEEKAAEKVPEMVANKVVEKEKEPYNTVPESVQERVTEKLVEKIPEAVIEISTKIPPQVIEQSKIANGNIPEYKTDFFNDTDSVQDKIQAIEVTEKPITQKVELEKPIVQKAVEEIVTKNPTVTEKPIVQEAVEEIVTEKPIAEKSVVQEAAKEIVTEKPIVQEYFKETVTEKPIVQEAVKETVTEKPIVQEKQIVKEIITEKPIVQKVVQEIVLEKPFSPEAVPEIVTPKDEPVIEKASEPVTNKPLSSSQEVFDTNEKASFDPPKYDPLPIMDLPTTTDSQQYNFVPAPAPDVNQNEDMQIKPKQIFNSDPLLKRFDRGGVGSVVELVNNKPENSEQVFKAPESETNNIVEIPVHEDVDEVKKEESGGFFGRAFKKLKIFSDDDCEQHFHKKDDHHNDHNHEHSVENNNHLQSENAHDHSHNTNDRSHNTNDHSHHNHDHSHNNQDHSHDNSHIHEPKYSQDVNEQQQKPSDVVGE